MAEQFQSTDHPGRLDMLTVRRSTDEQSQSTDHPDSFMMLTVWHSTDNEYVKVAKPIALRTSMTFEDLKTTLEGSFSQELDWIEVQWVGVYDASKHGTMPTEINEENCFLFLRLLKQRCGLDQLALTTFGEVSKRWSAS